MRSVSQAAVVRVLVGTIGKPGEDADNGFSFRGHGITPLWPVLEAPSSVVKNAPTL